MLQGGALCVVYLHRLPAGPPLSRAPVSASQGPASPGRAASSCIMPTSGNSPMAVSGIAKSVLWGGQGGTRGGRRWGGMRA
jgi:hypothetical protein